MQTSSGIEGKVVVITGASSGIGEATALLLAEHGAKVVLGARGSDRLNAMAVRIADAGWEVAHAPTDVRRRDDVSALIKLACERYTASLTFSSTTRESHLRSPLSTTCARCREWEDMVDINIKGLLYGIAAALPVFRKQGFGHFVNTASTAGLITMPNMAVYSATKFAVRAISEGMRQEAGDKLRVTIISPGFVQTNLADSIANPATKAQIADRMEKIAIPPDAIARAIAFAIEQPANVDVGEIIVRPTAQA